MDAPPPSPAAIAVLPAATVVGAGAGWTVWSELRSGRYVLDVRAPNGIVSMPPIASRGVPFDVDVGLDAARRPVAAYSRCATEPRPTGGANTIGPQWTSGRGCRLRLLDLASGQETKVARSSADASEVLPSLRGTRLAYIAVPRRHGERVAQLRRRDLRTGRSVRLDSGPRRAASAGFAEGPTSVDAGVDRVAAVWRYRDPEFHSFDTDLRVSRRSVAGASNSEECNYETVLSPTLVGDAVYFIDTTGTDWVLGRTPATRRSPRWGPASTGVEQVPTSAAVDGTRLVLATTQTSVGGGAEGTTTVTQRQLGAFATKSPVGC